MLAGAVVFLVGAAAGDAINAAGAVALLVLGFVVRGGMSAGHRAGIRRPGGVGTDR